MNQAVKNAQTETEAVADILRQGERIPREVAITRGDASSASVLMVPNGQGGYQLESVRKHLDEYLTAPERRKGTAVMLDLDSFIAHVNRFKDGGSVIFADDEDKTAPNLLAVIDYHPEGFGSPPRFGGHRTSHAFPVSEEWTAWNEKHEVEMNQSTFAHFLDDRIADICDPANADEKDVKILQTLGARFGSPAEILQLSRGLEVRAAHKFLEKVNTSSNELAMQFESTHTDAAGAPLTIPTAFLIRLRVFDRGALYTQAVRLRYNIDANRTKVTWFFSLVRPEIVFENAFKMACEQVATQTGLPLLHGKPE